LFGTGHGELMTRLARIASLVSLVAFVGCASPARLGVEQEGEELSLRAYRGELVEQVPGAGLEAPLHAPGLRLKRGEGVTRVRVLQKSDTVVHVTWFFLGEPEAQGARAFRHLGSLELDVLDDGDLELRAKGVGPVRLPQGVYPYVLNADGTIAENR
jgi:hypothetical protein